MAIFWSQVHDVKSRRHRQSFMTRMSAARDFILVVDKNKDEAARIAKDAAERQSFYWF
jgi:hypothetical protein